MNKNQRILFAPMLVVTLSLSACIVAATGQISDAATAVYSRGARQHTMSVILPVPPTDVFAAMNHLIDTDPQLIVQNRNDAAWMIEVIKNGLRYNLQATDLDNNRSLLFIWLDTGTTRSSPGDLALSAVESICNRLDVTFTVVER